MKNPNVPTQVTFPGGEKLVETTITEDTASAEEAAAPEAPEATPFLLLYGVRADSRAQAQVLTDVVAEREYQDGRWGGDEHDRQHRPTEWRDFVNDYQNRAMRAIARTSITPGGHQQNFSDYRRNLVKAAALLVAQIEALDAILGYALPHDPVTAN